ncbi:Osmosensitive K+ channel histidine kinase KdpD [Pseudomonas paraeruginosa]|nr:Osmosensitive K+ channel histidine kinase KdpD [Pseudomonas aeruginosa]
MTDTARADALLADLPGDGRGRLKVFLGAAPGVGKTFAMLQAAQAQLRQGVKLRAGVVETHSRAETEALLAGVPQQPLRSLEYRGMKLQEMDLDGLLADPPALALVDELAHSNVPGSRHAKRWQDIQELLAAGIDVYTTVNVQHLESLNDQVRDITGVQVRETVPDWVLQEAYEIVLIDLPPRELLERLREGKVYVPEQARAAIDAFFSQTNLTALRELAMQTAAARVDADLAHRYRQRGEEAPALRGCWWASTATSRPSAWCVTPAGSPSAATCPGAWCMSTPAGCVASRRGCACRAPSSWPERLGGEIRAPARWRGLSCNMPASAAPAWCWSASRGAAGIAEPSAAASPDACCATARAWRSVPWTARPICVRRNRGHAIRWPGTTICWRCWRPPWPADWPGAWRTCWNCRTSPWCSSWRYCWWPCAAA